MTKDEALQEYDEELARISHVVKAAHQARENARARLQQQLKALRDEHHQELKAIRALSQKTKGGKKW